MGAVHQRADGDAGVAQQAFELLVGRRFPAFERAAFVRIEIGVELDQDLECGRVRSPEIAHCPVGRQHQIVLVDPGGKIVRQIGPARCAGDVPRLPAKDALEKLPWLSQRRAIGFSVEEFLDRFSLDRRLAWRIKVLLADDVGADDEPDRPDVVEPFELRVGGGVEHHTHGGLGHR